MARSQYVGSLLCMTLYADDELGKPLVEMVPDLLPAADRYALDHLKAICELKFCENASAEKLLLI